MIGKPYAGKLQVRFDEGGTGLLSKDDPKRARSWKRRIQPRVGLKAVEPVLYSTEKKPFVGPVSTSKFQPRTRKRFTNGEPWKAGRSLDISLSG